MYTFNSSIIYQKITVVLNLIHVGDYVVCGMGSGVSILPEVYASLSEEEKVKAQAQFDALVAQGMTAEEAISNLQAVTTVYIPLTDLLTAIEQSVANGKTPLIVDRSADNKVDTFFSYRSAVVLDGKKMGLDKSINKIPVEEILESARKKLVNALKYGYPFVIALQQSVTDFATTFTDEACPDLPSNVEHYFPRLVFERGGKGLLSDESLNSLFREEDKEGGVAFCRDASNFHVVITTRFSPDDFAGYLFDNEWGLPKPQSNYQFIIIQYDENEPLLS